MNKVTSLLKHTGFARHTSIIDVMVHYPDGFVAVEYCNIDYKDRHPGLLSVASRIITE